MTGMTNQNINDQWNITKSYTLRYVIHAEVESYKQKGWKVVSDLSHCHHGAYSVIMQKPEEPQE